VLGIDYAPEFLTFTSLNIRFLFIFVFLLFMLPRQVCEMQPVAVDDLEASFISP